MNEFVKIDIQQEIWYTCFMSKIILPEVANAKLLKVNKPIIPLRDSIVVMGSDGTGKSTIGQIMREKLPHLEIYERWYNLQIKRRQDIGCHTLAEINKERW